MFVSANSSDEFVRLSYICYENNQIPKARVSIPYSNYPIPIL